MTLHDLNIISGENMIKGKLKESSINYNPIHTVTDYFILHGYPFQLLDREMIF